MIKDNKRRIFEVMGRLDKTFKPRLNEDLDDVSTEDEPIAALPSDVENDEEQKEKSPEEKLQELTAKVDELYAILHGETDPKETEIPEDAIAPKTGANTSTDSNTKTSTETDAYTQGNVTVTGGAGEGATTDVTISPPLKSLKNGNTNKNR
ncbi:MAG: hypothetical protein M0Q13_15315 [Methanothrix sp.]|jgi:hypothetical protein|nr:hypothetical protein [Methanothrix sp.]